jgi:hypothetical protein
VLGDKAAESGVKNAGGITEAFLTSNGFG